MGTVISLVSAGLGVALVPHTLTRLGLDGVVYRPLGRPGVRIPLASVRTPGDPSPALRRFLSTLRQTARTARAPR